MDDVAIAPATEDDIRAIARRRKFEETAFRVALELTERGTVWAARDAAEIVGIAIAHDSEEERYVGDLFVEPSYRGQGIGRRLLDGAFAGAGEVARSMLLDESDRGAYALAARFGLTASGVVAHLAGAVPREDDLARMAAGDYRFEVAALDLAAHEFALNALDREARGTMRMRDHHYFSREAFGQIFARNGEPIAYAYVWPDGRVGPLACVSPAYLVQVFGYVLVTLRRQYGASWCSVLVPSANLRLTRAALRASLRIQQSFVFAADSPGGAVANYLGFQKLLF
ncbi:MAG: GNAT family N-acetyltransferase [Candidatus Eremiobacteraeota bacterium]|nr:GNAT family N-acetyltransferase [Candidatus Eremiobacteraeota bacterium]